MRDCVLLSRARSGDSDALTELYRDHVGAALRYARAICTSVADAEDVVAESFANVMGLLLSNRGPDSSFRAYLFTAIRHGLYRASKRREYAVDDDSVLDQPVEDHHHDSEAESEVVWQAFRALTANDQEVLLLLDVHELRPGEVCSRLGMRSSTLSMRASRARRALAEAYLLACAAPGTRTG